MAVETFEKEVGESRRYEYDFSKWPELIAGATITAVAVTSIPGPPEDMSINVGAGSFSGPIAQTVIAGGTNGEVYVIKFEATLSAGGPIIGRGRLRVVDLQK